MPPFCSIIIPTLNEEWFLPKLLKDLVRQTDHDFETIVVDARSTDQTVVQIKHFPEINISSWKVNKRNVSYQRNFGASKAKGRFLIFLDADVRINKNFIAKLKTITIKHPGLIYIPSISPQINSPQDRVQFNIANVLVEISQITAKPFSTGGSMIWEKNFFRLIGGFDEKLYLAEDHYIVQLAKKWGVRARFLPQIQVKFCLRRLQKEGWLVSLSKNIRATAHVLLSGRIDKKIFEYEMGGSRYRHLIKQTAGQHLRSYLRQIERAFKEILLD